ncbi:MAG: thermonuclease family protein [Anaerolineae bacterium]|nr:thermonuclease family protein [Anaerolineae bacterium]
MKRLSLLIFVLLFLVASNQTVVGQTSNTTLEVARVVSIVDGDTIDVDLNNSRVRIRYIGINTPEINESCGGAATQANAALVQGKTVAMFRDVSNTDSYGRLLRYVFVGGTFVNAALVADGWAEAVEYPPDTTFADYFEVLEAEAAATNKGCHAFGAFASAATVPPPQHLLLQA